MFVNIIDATVVNVALPTIARDLGVPVEHTATVNIGFLVAVAVAIPVAGWLGDRLGPRGVFVVALALFTASSAACGLAGSVTQLVIFRVLQGLGGGLMTPSGMAMLYRTFPPEQRVRVSKVINIPIAVAPTIGPVLGGLLAEHASWRWIFGLNVPIGLAAIVFTLTMVKPLPKSVGGRLDVAGFLLAGLGFASLMFAVSEGPSYGWDSPLILGTGLAGVVLLAVLVPVQLSIANPMLNLRLFGLKLFRSANVITICSSAGFLGALFVYPLMLQNAFGYSAFNSGLLTFPEALGVMIGTQLVGRFYARVGPRRLVAAGQFTVGVCLTVLALVMTEHTPAVVPIALMAVIGIGQAHTFMPLQAAAFDTVPRRAIGSATGLYNATRQAGSAVGVAIAATVISLIGIGHTPATALEPFRWAMIGCACFPLLASMFALWQIDDADAAPSRGLRPAEAG